MLARSLFCTKMDAMKSLLLKTDRAGSLRLALCDYED
jgi:hypothetical protein